MPIFGFFIRPSRSISNGAGRPIFRSTQNILRLEDGILRQTGPGNLLGAVSKSCRDLEMRIFRLRSQRRTSLLMTKTGLGSRYPTLATKTRTSRGWGTNCRSFNHNSPPGASEAARMTVPKIPSAPKKRRASAMHRACPVCEAFESIDGEGEGGRCEVMVAVTESCAGQGDGVGSLGRIGNGGLLLELLPQAVMARPAEARTMIQAAERNLRA